MSDSDDRIDRMLCRWAAAKYELRDVTRVDFDSGQHGPYSEVTPDVDSYVEVSVWTAERERLRDEQHARRLQPGEPWTRRLQPGESWATPHRFEESYSGGLIRDILRFAIDSDTL